MVTTWFGILGGWWVLFDPRAQGIDEKERIDARRGTKASNRRQSLDRELK